MSQDIEDDDDDDDYDDVDDDDTPYTSAQFQTSTRPWPGDMWIVWAFTWQCEWESACSRMCVCVCVRVFACVSIHSVSSYCASVSHAAACSRGSRSTS